MHFLEDDIHDGLKLCIIELMDLCREGKSTNKLDACRSLADILLSIHDRQFLDEVLEDSEEE